MKHDYHLSFTTGSFRKSETVKLAQVYLEFKDWTSVRSHVIQNNILQQRTTASSKRLYIELSQRLKCLSDEELTDLATGADTDANILIWVAICRRYRLIYDFVVEVVREHYLSLNYQVDHSDFDSFYTAKASIHDNLANASDSTRYKVRQVIFKMLRDVGLLTNNNAITPIIISNPAIRDLLTNEDILIFLQT